jgi:hypothetical protein
MAFDRFACVDPAGAFGRRAATRARPSGGEGPENPYRSFCRSTRRNQRARRPRRDGTGIAKGQCKVELPCAGRCTWRPPSWVETRVQAPESDHVADCGPPAEPLVNSRIVRLHPSGCPPRTAGLRRPLSVVPWLILRAKAASGSSAVGPCPSPVRLVLAEVPALSCSATWRRKRTSSARSAALNGSSEAPATVSIRRRSSRTHLASELSTTDSSRATSCTGLPVSMTQ